MSGIVVGAGGVLCEALQVGLPALRCYDEGFLLGLGWMAAALLLVALAAASKGLQRAGRV
jgi:hypothetical protein